MKKRFLVLLAFLVLGQVSGQGDEPEPIILNLMEINNIENDLSEKEIRQFKTRFEVGIQDKKPYLVLINPQYDQAIIESVIRSIRHKTAKDLFRYGELKNEDVIILIDLYEKEKGFATTIYKCDLRLLEVRTGEIYTLEVEAPQITSLAENCANEVYGQLWTGVVEITTDQRQYRLTVDDNPLEIVRTQHYKLPLMKGRHTITLEKEGFRAISEDFDIKPGSNITRSYSFIKRGAQVVIEGEPEGATIVLEGRHGKYTGTIPYNNMLPEDVYLVTVDHDGYFPVSKKIKIRDNRDIHNKISLPPMNFRTVRNKSLVFPGLGQYYFGHKLKGFSYIVGEVVALLSVGAVSYLFLQKKNYRDDLVDRYWDGEVGLRSNIRSTEKTMKILQRVTFATSAGVFALYLYNIYDIYRYRPLFNGTTSYDYQNRYEKAFDELERDNQD